MGAMGPMNFGKTAFGIQKFLQLFNIQQHLWIWKNTTGTTAGNYGTDVLKFLMNTLLYKMNCRDLVRISKLWLQIFTFTSKAEGKWIFVSMKFQDSKWTSQNQYFSKSVGEAAATAPTQKISIHSIFF